MESERLFLTEITENDAEIIVKWRSDYETYRYFLSPHKLTLGEHLNWFNISYLKNDSRTDYIASLKSTGEKIGVFGIILSGDTVEVNYLLGKDFRGKGYAREAVELLIDFTKAKFGSKTAIAEVHRNNLPSIALAKRLGFKEAKQNGEILIFEKEI